MRNLGKPQRIAPLDHSHGVYFLFIERELVYVGRSRNPYDRIASHRANGRAFDDYVVAHCEAGQSQWVEKALILALGPHQNRKGKVMHDPQPEPPVVTQAGVTEIIYRDRIVRGTARKDDPNEMESVQHWREHLKAYGLGQAFGDAVAANEVPSFWKNPALTGPKQRRLVRRGDMQRWLKAKQKERQIA